MSHLEPGIALRLLLSNQDAGDLPSIGGSGVAASVSGSMSVLRLRTAGGWPPWAGRKNEQFIEGRHSSNLRLRGWRCSRHWASWSVLGLELGWSVMTAWPSFT